MKAVVVSTPGGPEVLEVVERPKPVLKAGWTLVKIQGFGINHSEIFTRKGKSPSVKFPRVLGRNDSTRFEDWPANHFHYGGDGASF